MKSITKIFLGAFILCSSQVLSQETLQQVTDNGSITSNMIVHSNNNGIRLLQSNISSSTFNSIHIGQYGGNSQFMRFLPKSTGTGDWDWSNQFYYDFTNTNWGVQGVFKIDGSLDLTGKLNIFNSTENVQGYFNSDSENSKFIFSYLNTGGAELEFQHDGDIILAQAGNVGIGITNPLTKLHLLQDNEKGLRLERSGHDSYELRLAGSRGLNILNTTEGEYEMVFDGNGNVGIGTETPQSKLAVNGQIRANEVKVLANVNDVPDYVFEPDYDLRTLKETKEYITKNKHLPEIPSAAEIGENGIDLGDMNMRLLKKIEELTLYQIQLMEEMEEMKKELKAMKN